MLILASGCAINRPSPTARELSDKREEIEVLRAEMDLAIRQLDHLQRSLGTNSTYSAEAQARDLDAAILVIRQARDRLGGQYRRLHDEFGVWDGPY
jgi:hypothetical protein